MRLIYDIKQEFWYNVEWIKKVFSYALFLRKDFDFDSGSIFRLLSFNISRVRKCLEADTWHKPMPKEIRRMKTCEALLTRLHLQDYYFQGQPWKDYLDKFPLDFSKRMTEEQKQAIDKLAAHEARQEAQDLEYFWKVFSKHHKKWWS